LPAFYTLPAPALRADERAISYETSELPDRAVRLGPVARVYAWGPRSGEWEHNSHWLARWSWPFGASPDIRSSQPSPTPPILLDVARFGTTGSAGMMPPGWTLAIGDDPSHGLLIGRRSARADAVVYELESDRAPVEIRRAD